ncbi:MAG: hypothetical protein KDJ40_23545, partial [Hyphomicrobiales bacterium]|nr:hypothetical protein [Hyphomicrobiales bacterium]
MNRPFNVPIALPRGPEHYWSIAKKFGAKGFTLGELAGCTNGVAYSTVKAWLYAMVKQGAVKQIGSRKSAIGQPAHVYAVAIKTAKAPVQRRQDYQGVRGKTQQQVWTAMRTLGTFSLVELTAAASTPEQPVKRRTAEEYVRRLANAGVLAVVEPYAKGKPGATGARAGTWR